MSEGNSVITEQLSEGPSNGGITESVPATGAEQPGEGPGNGGGDTQVSNWKERCEEKVRAADV